jgi:hypothetical protein
MLSESPTVLTFERKPPRANFEALMTIIQFKHLGSPIAPAV